MNRDWVVLHHFQVVMIISPTDQSTNQSRTKCQCAMVVAEGGLKMVEWSADQEEYVTIRNFCNALQSS
jgi:hypothetical protein